MCTFARRIVWKTYVSVKSQKLGKRERKQKGNRIAQLSLSGLVIAPLFLNTILFASLVVAQNILWNFIFLLIPYVLPYYLCT